MRNGDASEGNPNRACAVDGPGRETVDVLIPFQSGGPYTYWVAEEKPLHGGIVRVPFGNRQMLGVAVGPSGVETPPVEKLKPLSEILDTPPFPDSLLRFLDWTAGYTCTPLGALLKMALAPSLSHTPRRAAVYRPSHAEPAAAKPLSPGRSRVLTVLADDRPRSARDLAEAAGVSAGLIRRMAQDGLLAEGKAGPDMEIQQPDPDAQGPCLSDDQARLAQELRKARGFASYLLDGVTGSGKTEVYFEAIAETLRRGRQSLVLMPEIALTAGWLDRFASRFGGVQPVAWHSALTPAARSRAWRAAAEGKAAVVVGARSALFLPFRDLGLIVVDEEHDSGYKQEDGVTYHARDLAVVRARENDAAIILVSATPSLESHVNAEAGRYQRLRLDKRHGGALPPTIEAIDLRDAPPEQDSWLSPVLITALGDTLARGEQALLFLNRRGYAPLTLCRACGHRLECPNCSVCLVQHRRGGVMLCHHCGQGTKLPPTCPSCEAKGKWAPCGPGVERIEEEVERLFPDARRLLLSSDLLNGPAEMKDMFRRIVAREADILIGTQIIAKGHHFPQLTLVGVIDADLGLDGGDLRAAERTHQLLHQVAGRAGRAERPGKALLQTYSPDHPVIRALLSGERDGFLSAEAAARRRLGLPPFGRLAAIIVSGTDEARVEQHARALASAAPRRAGLEVFGPAPAPLTRLRRRHRWRLLAKTARTADLSAVMGDWVAAVIKPSGVGVRIDIDPQSFL